MPKLYTEEFEADAVRLALTSGQSQRSICEDLGVSRTTLVRWLAEHRRRGEKVAAVAGNDEVLARLRRLRRENEVLHQERDILKKAIAFFAREGSR